MGDAFAGALSLLRWVFGFRRALGSEWIGGPFPDACFYDDKQKDADGGPFGDAVGEIGEGWGELFEEEAADEEDQGEAHQGYFE